MRFTRRLPDRNFVFIVILTAGCAAVSCSSEDDGSGLERPDAGWEASTPDGEAEPSDAGFDVTMKDVASPPFDGGPLPVVCGPGPCAKSLVTTLPSSDYDYDLQEGYCALLDDGTVACWGANEAGQLGRGDDLDDAVPARVVGLSDVVRLDHTCALDKSGGVWCWGTGPFLRDDAGASTTERTPVKLPLPPATSVGVSVDVGCAVVDTGVVCWGANRNAQVAPLSTDPALDVLPPQPIPLPSGAPVRDVVVGKAAFVVREDGVTLSWGANPPLARASSLNPDPYPTPLALGSVSSIDLRRDCGCATVGGIGYCWGPGTRVTPSHPPLDRALPEPVVAPEPLVQIATTKPEAYFDISTPVNKPQRWCGVGASGAVYCWGINANGQVGDGTKEAALQAKKVEGLPSTAAQVKTLTDSTCALLTNGKVYCWGANYYGQLGNGKLKVRSLVPEEVLLP